MFDHVLLNNQEENLEGLHSFILKLKVYRLVLHIPVFQERR